MSTIQDDIMSKIIGYMQDISISNGYSFDMDADRVYEFRAAPVDVSDFAISVYDFDGEAEDDGSFEHSLNVTIEITGIFTSIQDLREKMQDIITAFSNIESSNSVDYAELISHEKSFEHENNKIGQATMIFRVVYKSGRWKI